MSFLGNYLDTKITEATLSRDMIRNYVRMLYRRSDFPDQVFVSLGDSALVSTGDVVWANIDPEHPYDWLPIPRIDDLVLNLPTKAAFLRELGADTLQNVSPAEEAKFWDAFEFEYADEAAGVKLIWT